MGIYDRKTAPVPALRKVNTPGPPPWFDKRTERQQLDAMRNKESFIVWDGEGVNNDSNGKMSLVLFGHSGNGDPQYIRGRSLSTLEIVEFIWEQFQDFTTEIHVSYGFNFDVDQILADLDDNTLRELLRDNEVKWKEWKFRYIPRKFFSITKGRRRGITIYDCISFFGTTLINACREYLGNDPRIEKVNEGKAGRSSFSYDELDSIILPYWKLEGELMVSLMYKLRQNLTGAGIKLKAWHGPGSIANSLIERENIGGHIQSSRVQMPSEVTEATAFAYFGGRFENFMIGHIPGPIYSYDIRSAYPAALSQMPGLEGGQWVHKNYPKQISVWGIYRVKCKTLGSVIGMGALPNRAADGSVSYALATEGWYFGHEVVSAQMTNCDIDIYEGWTYEGGDGLPFVFLYEMYLQRAAWKREGNPAQLAAKLGLNSIYGKLAQLTGWDEKLRIPPKFHQQWYAGHTTSWCRARLMLAMAQEPKAIVACETDGIYSLEPLRVPIGNGLGEWESEVYGEAVYVQSGVYWMKTGDEWTKAKTRGLSSGAGGLTVQDAFRNLNTLEPLSSNVHRYGSMTGHIGRENHHAWYDQNRTIVWGGNGKRNHNPNVCPKCQGNGGPHRTIISRPICGNSFPRLLPWVDDKITSFEADSREHDPLAESLQNRYLESTGYRRGTAPQGIVWTH